MEVATLLAAAPFATRAALNASGAVRLRNAQIIVREFTAAGYPLSLALAAVVNAEAESRLDNTAGGDGGGSIGLFQLSSTGGGRGMTVAQRQDPELNTRRIIQEFEAARRNTKGKDKSRGISVSDKSMDQAVEDNDSLARLAGLFCFHVERPEALVLRQREREALARTLFPTVANLPVGTIDGALVALRSGLTWGTYIIGAASVIGLAYLLRRRLTGA